MPINNNTQHVLKRIAVADSNMLKEVQKEVEVMVSLSPSPKALNVYERLLSVNYAGIPILWTSLMLRGITCLTGAMRCLS